MYFKRRCAIAHKCFLSADVLSVNTDIRGLIRTNSNQYEMSPTFVIPIFSELSLVVHATFKLGQSVVGNLEHPARVDHTVGGLEAAVGADHRVVQVSHTLKSRTLAMSILFSSPFPFYCLCDPMHH